MNIYLCGLNHKTAPLEAREMFSFTPEETKKALLKLKEQNDIEECAILSTCNRTEVYIYTKEDDFNRSELEELLCVLKGLSLYDYKKYFYFYAGQKAVRHLFKVACGLESMVLGEDEILRQVKNALEIAQKTKTTAAVLNTLFRDSVTVAKKVKTWTGISRKAVSVASLAVSFIAEQFENCLTEKTALIIGGGEVGTVVLKNLLSKEIGKVYLASRTHRRLLAEVEEGVVLKVDYENRYDFLDEADIVISCTSSPHYTITADVLEGVLSSSKKRVFVDLAVPRDIDLEVKNIEGVAYYNIDDLKKVGDRNLSRRLEESLKAEKMIEEAVSDFEKWYEFRNVLPVVQKLQEETHRLAEENAARLINKLGCFKEEEQRNIKKAMHNLADFMMNRFVYEVRENGTKEEIETYFKCLKELLS